MELDEASNSVEVRLLGPWAVLFDANAGADAIGKKHRRNARHQTGLFGPRIANHSQDFQGLYSSLTSAVWPIRAKYSGDVAPYFPGAFARYISLGRSRRAGVSLTICRGGCHDSIARESTERSCETAAI